MKTFKNMMMAMSAVTMMMAASINTATATNHDWKMVTPKTSEMSMSETSPTSRLLQYDYVNEEINENRHFIYCVDAEGRVTDRIMYGWDNDKKTWVPISLTHAKYGKHTHTLTHLCWDAKAKHFGKKETQKFDAAKFPGTMISLPQGASER